MKDAKFSGKKSASTEILLSCDFSVTLTLFFNWNVYFNVAGTSAKDWIWKKTKTFQKENGSRLLLKSNLQASWGG